MPRCELTKAAMVRIRNTKHTRKTVYMDADICGLLLEYRPTGTGTWYFRAKDRLGKRKTVRLGLLPDMDVLEAKAQAYELMKTLERGDFWEMAPFRGNRLCFIDFIGKYYQPYAEARKRGWPTEAIILRRHILPIFGSVRLDAVTRFSISHWLEILQAKGLAPTTCNRALFLMKHIFTCARRWGFLTMSPAQDVKALPEMEFRERYLSTEEARRLLGALAEDRNLLAAQAIRLLLFTGARRSEILTARWENVDVERRILTVPLSKSGRVRHIPLSDAALQVLRGLPRETPWLFPSSRTDSHISSIFNAWDRVRTKAGLKDVRLHDLRHSFASFLVNSGCSLYEVQKILGHQNPKVTMRYAHLTQDSLLRAANIVGKKFGDVAKE